MDAYDARGAIPTLPLDWRRLLPSARDNFNERLKGKQPPAENGWARAYCPLHDDATRSLSVNVLTGHWRCHAGCGGGDLIALHMKLTGKRFKDAVLDLTRSRRP